MASLAQVLFIKAQTLGGQTYVFIIPGQFMLAIGHVLLNQPQTMVAHAQTTVAHAQTMTALCKTMTAHA